MTLPLLSIIIINYKTPDLTKQCIKSILSTTSNQIEIIVVDNCPDNTSEKEICGLYPTIRWINNTENVGFGRANNIGAEASKGEYLLFLNSDVILFEHTIQNALSHMINDTHTGLLGCKLLNQDYSHQKSVYYYIGDFMAVLKNNLLFDYFYKDKSPSIKAVMGAFMLMPKKVFNEVKGFDPDFFMYAEELELCHRLSKKGYKINYFEGAEAIHLHGGSSKGSDWSDKQNYLSNALLYLKVKGYWGYITYHLLATTTFIMNTLLLWKMDKNYRRDFLHNQKCYFSNFGAYFKIPFLYTQSMGNGKRLLKRA